MVEDETIEEKSSCMSMRDDKIDRIEIILLDKFVLWFGRLTFPFLFGLNVRCCCEAFNKSEFGSAVFSAVVAAFMAVMAIKYWKNGEGREN